jgi:CheY-like chemotaxis protein
MTQALVVDDDASLRALVADCLREVGCSVREAANGLEALRLVRQRRPDLIVLDLAMPVMDGRTFAEQCNRDSDIDAIPIVLLSAEYEVKYVAAQLRSLGVRAYLRKPFDLDALVLAIDELVSVERLVA